MNAGTVLQQIGQLSPAGISSSEEQDFQDALQRILTASRWIRKFTSKR
jgi:hypothetical protein